MEQKDEDFPRMDIPEQFVYAIRNVPMLAERLQCMMVSETFEEEEDGAIADIKQIADACAEFEQPQLKELLLGVILPFGEILHKGTKKAGAKGIRIAGLQAIADTKTAKDTKKTALRYIVEALARKRPHLLDIVNKFPRAFECKSASMDKPELGVKAITRSADTLNKALERARETNDEQFIRSLGAFCEDAAQRSEAIQARFDDMVSAFKKTCEYMGEVEDRIRNRRSSSQPGASSSRRCKERSPSSTRTWRRQRKRERRRNPRPGKPRRKRGRRRRRRRRRPRKLPKQKPNGSRHRHRHRRTKREQERPQAAVEMTRTRTRKKKK